MVINIKKIKHSPVRYGLFNQDKLIFSISSAVKKFFNLQEKEEIDTNKLKEIRNKEKNQIKSDMLHYLAKAERSPQKVRDWLQKRDVEKSEINELLREAQQKNFLSQERFIKNYIEKYQEKGNKSLALIKQELLSKGIDQKHLNSLNFDETKALKNYILKNYSKFKNNRKKFINNLLKKGFDFSNVKAAIEEIDNENLGN